MGRTKMESNLYQALGKFFLAMQFRSFAVIFEAAASATAVPNTIVGVPKCFVCGCPQMLLFAIL